jgi:O-antigen/teichoic acid export membrane protein
MIFAIVIAIDTGLGKPKIHHGKSLLNFSKYSLLGAAGGKLYNWGDVLILGFFVSSSAIGAYEIAWRVSQSMMLLAQSIRRTIYPRISAWDAEGKQHRIRELISDAILPSTYLSIPAFFGVILYSEQILVFIFDSGAGMASMALTVLMFEKIVRSLHMTISPAIMALDRPDLIVFPVAVISITNITLNIPLIWKFGITGAAVGTSTASIVGAMIYINNLNKLITIQMPWKELVWCTISSIVMFLLLSLINEYIFVDDLVGLIIFICLGALIYFVTTLTFSPIRVYILENIPSIGYGPGSHL